MTKLLGKFCMKHKNLPLPPGGGAGTAGLQSQLQSPRDVGEGLERAEVPAAWTPRVRGRRYVFNLSVFLLGADLDFSPGLASSRSGTVAMETGCVQPDVTVLCL